MHKDTSREVQASKLLVLTEIAKRQQAGKRRNRIFNRMVIVLLIALAVAALVFGIMLLFADKKYTVTFYVNSEIVRRIEIAEGKIIDANDIPDNPESPENMEFMGWFTNQTAEGEAFAFENSAIRNNINLYAGFTPTTVTLKVYLNDGTNNFYTVTGKHSLLTNILNQNYLNENLSSDYKDEVNYTLLGFDKRIDATTATYTRYQQVPLFEGVLFAVWQGREVDIIITSTDARYWGGEPFTDQTIVSNYGSKVIINTSIYSNIYQQGTGARVNGVMVEVPGQSATFYKHGDEVTVTDNMTFRLAFENKFNSLTIIYGNEVDPTETHFGYGREITLRANVFLDNYRLIGYTDGSNVVLPGEKVKIYDELLYTAIWESLVYTITLENDAEYQGTTEIYLKYADGFYGDIKAENIDIINSITAPLKTKHNFLGYFTEKNGQGEQIISAVGDIIETNYSKFTSDTTLYAHFEITTYTVIVENNEYGTIYPVGVAVSPDNTYTVEVGDNFRFTVTLNDAYTQRYISLLVKLREQNAAIEKISAGSISASTRFDLANISDDATITVPSFPINTYEISWRNSDNQNTLLKRQTYEHGEIVIYDLPDPTKEGTEEISYKFAGWSPQFEDIALQAKTYIAQYTNLIKQPISIPTLIYNGSAQSINIDTLYYSITSDSYINVGNYTATASLKDESYVWDNALENSDDVILDWQIIAQKLIAPQLIEENYFTYNGNNQRLTDALTYFDGSVMDITGHEGKNANSYMATISIKEEKAQNYEWADDAPLTNGNVIINWEITPAHLKIIANNKSMFYGYPRPSIDYKLEGLLGGDNESSALTGAITLTTEASSTALPGFYAITFENTESVSSQNYTLEFIDGVIEIVYNETILVPSLYEIEFDYTSNTITPSLVLFNEHVMEIVAGSQTSARDAGTYTITVRLKGNNRWGDLPANPEEYRGTNKVVVINWTIHPTKLTVTANDKTIIYGESQPRFDVSFSGWKGGDNEFNATSFVIVNGSLSENAFNFNVVDYAGNAGEYEIEVEANEAISKNYEFEFVSGLLKVLYIELSKPTLEYNLVYNGGLQNIVSALAGFNASTMDIQGNLQKDANVDDDGEVVNEYKAIISLLDNVNYRWINEENGNDTEDIEIAWVIEKSNLTVKPIDKSVITGTSVLPDFDLSYSGFMGSDDESSIIGNFNVTAIADLETEGEYDIIITAGSAQSVNYKFNFVNGKLKVTSSESITIPEISASPFTYTGETITPIIENFNSDIMYIVEESSVQSARDVGIYTITIALNNTDNKWENSTSGPIGITWEIKHAQLIIKANDVTVYYGQSYDLDYTIMGLRPSDNLPDLNIEFSSHLPTNVGTYTINFVNPSPIGVVGNYNIEWQQGILNIVSPIIQAPYLTRDSFVYSASEINILAYFNIELSDSIFNISEVGSADFKAIDVGGYTIIISLKENYTWADSAGANGDGQIIISWQITPADLIIAAHETTLIYRDEIPSEFGYTITGWQGDENENLMSGKFAFSTNVGQVFPVNVGRYIISIQTGSMSILKNYNYIFEDAYLHVEKLVLTAPTTSQTVFEYSGFEQQLVLNGFDDITMSVVGHRQTYANVNDAGEVLTPYIAVISLVDKNNYSWTEDTIVNEQGDIEIEWIINKAELSIRGNSLTIQYKTISPWPPQFSLSFSGFKENGDNEFNAIDGEITIETNANFFSTVGPFYYIRPNVSNATSVNYRFKVLDGVLTIVPQKLEKPTAKERQFVFDNITKTLVFESFDDTTMRVYDHSKINADRYIAVIELIDPINYNWEDDSTTNIEISWEILVREVSKPIVEGTLVYNGRNQSPTIVVDDFYDITGNIGLNAGEYTAIVSLRHNTRPDGKPNMVWLEDGLPNDIELVWYIEKYNPVFKQMGKYEYYYGQQLNYLDSILKAEEATGPLHGGTVGVIEGIFDFVVPSQVPGVETTKVNIMFTPINSQNYHDAVYALDIKVIQLVITFESNNGSSVDPILGKWNESYPEPNKPTRAGYIFAGWHLDNTTFENAVSWPHILLESVTFYAKWDLKILTVSFYEGSNRGTASVKYPNDDALIGMPTQTFSYTGDTAPVYNFNLELRPVDDPNYNPNKPYFTNNLGFRLFEKATGKRVIGVQIGGVSEIYTSSIEITDDIVLYFVFAANADTVTFDYKGGSLTGLSSGLPNDTFAGRGTKFDIKDVKYQFYYLLGYVNEEDNPNLPSGAKGPDVSWDNAELGLSIRLYQYENLINGNEFYVTEGQHRYYAVWAPITVRFIYHENSGTGQSSPTTNQARYETKNFLLAEKGTLSRTHYTFAGWSKSTAINNQRERSNILDFGEAQRVVNLDNQFLSNILNNYQTYTYKIEDEVMVVTMYACWIRNRVTIKFDYTEGSGTPSECTDFFSGEEISNTGSDARLKSNPTRTGYKQDGWSLSKGGSKLPTKWTVPPAPNGEMTLYARWQRIVTTVTLRLQGGRVGSQYGPLTVSVTYGDQNPNFPIPTRDSESDSWGGYYTYSFRGYWTAASGGRIMVRSDGRLSSSPWTEEVEAMTLYAQWSSTYHEPPEPEPEPDCGHGYTDPDSCPTCNPPEPERCSACGSTGHSSRIFIIDCLCGAPLYCDTKGCPNSSCPYV